MSMLSAQTDNLRIMARLVREYEYKEIKRVLLEAADTIDDLRTRIPTCELDNRIVFYQRCSRVTWGCKVCGARFIDYLQDEKHDIYHKPNYCPSCGARVVS